MDRQIETVLYDMEDAFRHIMALATEFSANMDHSAAYIATERCLQIATRAHLMADRLHRMNRGEPLKQLDPSVMDRGYRMANGLRVENSFRMRQGGWLNWVMAGGVTYAIGAVSFRHQLSYLIQEKSGRWELIHPWTISGRIKEAQSEMFDTLWAAMNEAERMEREGTRFPKPDTKA